MRAMNRHAENLKARQPASGKDTPDPRLLELVKYLARRAAEQDYEKACQKRETAER
jgi:hypothetical protein